MRSTASIKVLSATDLSGFISCRHFTAQQRAATEGRIQRPRGADHAHADVLRELGERHEQAYLARLRAEGLAVVQPDGGTPGDEPLTQWAAGNRATLEAMQSAADVIYQPTLFDGAWVGRADFLRKVPRPSDLGGWSYEVVDTKLAREAKAGAVLQITHYSELVGRLQGQLPEFMYLLLGRGEQPERFRVRDFIAYYHAAKRELEAFIGMSLPAATYPDPVEHCDVCEWQPDCELRWRADDHLSLVAGITRNQRERLVARGTSTVRELSKLHLPLVPSLDGVSPASLERVRDQARVQIEGRDAGSPKYELFEDIDNDFGLAALPEPSKGDIFFDIEGDPFAFDAGLEYLLGYVVQEEGNAPYAALWALDPAEERRAFEQFIDFAIERLGRHPDLHIYHYAAYEPSAIKRLACRHSTREAEVDRLLRGKVFVDLYRVVRQGLRASVESYSIKKLEPFYGFRRVQDLREASSALREFEASLQLGGECAEMAEGLARIEAYNREDCLSALELRTWLEARRAELESRGVRITRPSPGDLAPSEAVQEIDERIRQLVTRLTERVPDDAAARNSEQQARWLLAQLLGFHRREDKSAWWEYFRLRDLSDGELVEERTCLGGLEYAGVVGSVRRSDVHRFRFPPQDCTILPGNEVRDPRSEENPGAVHAIDPISRTIDIARGKNREVPTFTALIPYELVGTKELRESLCSPRH